MSTRTINTANVVMAPDLSAEPFEIIIARKIKNHKMSMLKVFMRLDEDQDSKISKKDLKSSMRSMWNIDLTDGQIDHMLKRASYFAPSKVTESRKKNTSPTNVDYETMGYQEYSKYIEATASSRTSASSTLFGSTSINASPERSSFKGNVVYDKGINTSSGRSTLKGDVAKCLKDKSSGKNDLRSKMTQKLSTNHLTSNNSDSETDKALIWSFLDHFHHNHIGLIEAFHILDISNSNSLSAIDIHHGLKKIDVEISVKRARSLTSKYVDVCGRMNKPGFVRFLTSAPKAIQ